MWYNILEIHWRKQERYERLNPPLSDRPSHPQRKPTAAEGHPWIYDNELDSLPSCPDGTLVDAVSAKGRYIGTGYYNSRSKIRLRLISRNSNDVFDQGFYRRRLQYAYDYRKAVLSPQDLRCCRLILEKRTSFPD